MTNDNDEIDKLINPEKVLLYTNMKVLIELQIQIRLQCKFKVDVVNVIADKAVDRSAIAI